MLKYLGKESPSSVERIGETQALLRVQAQIHAGRAQILHSPSSIAHLHISILNCLLHLVFPLFFFLLFFMGLDIKIVDKNWNFYWSTY